jgi:hypothetical protein
MMANAERALERLYEDSDIRDELRDPEAQSLLKWAEAQVIRLAEESADDAEFDTKFETLRGMLKDMNRFVGKRAELDSAAQAAKLGEISAAALALGAPAGVSAQAAADWKGLDDSAALNTLLNIVSPPSEPIEAAAHAVESAPENAPLPSAPPLSAAPSADDSSAAKTTSSAIVPAEDKPKDLAQLYPGKTPLYPMPPKETEPNDEAQDT